MGGRSHRRIGVFQSDDCVSVLPVPGLLEPPACAAWCAVSARIAASPDSPRVCEGLRQSAVSDRGFRDSCCDHHPADEPPPAVDDFSRRGPGRRGRRGVSERRAHHHAGICHHRSCFCTERLARSRDQPGRRPRRGRGGVSGVRRAALPVCARLEREHEGCRAPWFRPDIDPSAWAQRERVQPWASIQRLLRRRSRDGLCISPTAHRRPVASLRSHVQPGL